MRHVHRLWILPLLASLLLACEMNLFENLEPPTQTDLQVGPGVTPTFTWVGDEADQLVGRRDGEAVWLVTAARPREGYHPGYAGMAPPITYGVPPAGAWEHIRVEVVLTAGVTYEVVVTVMSLLSEGAVARRSFTPQVGSPPPP
jgi:hypothetical protein